MLAVNGVKPEKSQCEKELLKRIQEYVTEVGYWKKQHDRARKREEELKKELKDKKARIRYLEHQLYNKKNERSKPKSEKKDKERPLKRKKGHQKGTPGNEKRNYNDLETKPELFDIREEDKICSICGKPLYELPGTDDSEIIEIEVKGYKRKIRRKKYVKKCKCITGKQELITAPGPDKLIKGSKIGISIWICILIRKFCFQIPVARILKNLHLNGLDLAAGTIGDGLKRMAPLFAPVYTALEERSRQADWWQADETRWNIFEQTKSKTSYRWYLWVFISTESVVHIMDPTRAARVIEDHLGTEIEGILLVDRYSAYKSFARKKEGILLAFCWSHTRRDFIDAGKKYPVLKVWADEWEEKINSLFHQNNLRIQYPLNSNQFSREDTLLRISLDSFEQHFKEELKATRLHHEKKKVLNSLQNHWAGLTVFLDHPQIPMDNNGSERTLRNPALGRKNYYGSQTVWSGQFTATMLSIFETLRLWKINEQQWLTNYLNACAANGGQSPEDVEPFLPWHIKEAHEPTFRYSGRDFSQADIQCIKDIIDEDTSHNRTAISRLACEYLQWHKPDGSTKDRSMRIALLKMETDGHLVLPPVQKSQPDRSRQKVVKHTDQTDPGEEIFTPAGALPELKVAIAETASERDLWNEYVDRYHYLGYTTIPGACLKYFISAGHEIVALLGFGAAAWRVAPRDRFISWTDEMRQKNLHLVINNARFLILPWVFSKNLASKILSVISNRVADDWENHYKYRPVLMETFVEQKRFQGTCYKAANWQYLGLTKGRGKKDRFNKAALPKKSIFIYPLDKQFKELLC